MLREYLVNTFFGVFVALFFFIGPIFLTGSIGVRIGMVGCGCHAVVLMLRALRHTPRTRPLIVRIEILGTILMFGGVALHFYID